MAYASGTPLLRLGDPGRWCPVDAPGRVSCAVTACVSFRT